MNYDISNPFKKKRNTVKKMQAPHAVHSDFHKNRLQKNTVLLFYNKIIPCRNDCIFIGII